MTPWAEQICDANVMAEAWSAALQSPTRQQATLERKSWLEQIHFASVPQPPYEPPVNCSEAQLCYCGGSPKLVKWMEGEKQPLYIGRPGLSRLREWMSLKIPLLTAQVGRPENWADARPANTASENMVGRMVGLGSQDNVLVRYEMSCRWRSSRGLHNRLHTLCDVMMRIADMEIERQLHNQQTKLKGRKVGDHK